MSTLENRVNELEAKIAFQDETIEILNDELKTHQKLISKIQRQTELLAEKVKESQSSDFGSEQQIEPPPPHY
ncbi:SlyX family protein [Pseudoalteromonas denitrificans]|uniref:Protein SlyX homolog n=1 Tax=Pseudoalteromonas denitrificans DSM 6059 TaxID=1123010 RepID=A0A1I1TZV6_9GAMM|nr:SlyX family protein [Pseudoalteromonas denitrificans]SFD64029.1 SlyX protein [Pseudoalteromonas denitrificans DSM 6059]